MGDVVFKSGQKSLSIRTDRTDRTNGKIIKCMKVSYTVCHTKNIFFLSDCR
jgi:hypothetical protein